MSGDQIPAREGRKRRQTPGVCLGGGMLKLRFDWYIITYHQLVLTHQGLLNFSHSVIVQLAVCAFQKIK